MPDNVTPSAVPPPTAEVTVRTLESDLAAVQASGGTLLSPAGINSGVTFDAAHPVIPRSASRVLALFLGWLAVFAILIGIALGGWVGYNRLTSRTDVAASSTKPVQVGASSSLTSSSTSLASLLATVSEHKSLLTKSAGFTTSFPLEAPAGTLKTRYQLIREGFDRIPASARVAELTPTDAQGRPLSFPGYAAAVDAPDLFDATAYSQFIENDFTLLALRGSGGFSLAYVFALKPNTTWIYAEPTVKTIEVAPRLSNLFLQLPGTSIGAFADDASVGGQAVRSATTEKPAGTLTYGWFRDRLIIATSRQALNQALLLICFGDGSC